MAENTRIGPSPTLGPVRLDDDQPPPVQQGHGVGPKAAGDSFARGPATMPGADTHGGQSHLLASRGSGRPVGPRADGSDGGSRIAIPPGTDWQHALARRYGGRVSAELVRLIAAYNHASPNGLPPAIVSLPDAATLFAMLHGPQRGKALSSETRYLIVQAGQSWSSLAQSLYGDLDSRAAAGVGQMLAHMNGRSPYEPPPVVIAAADLAQLGRALTTIRALEATRASGRVRRPRQDTSTIEQMHGSLANPAPVPTAGEAYRPRWNDTLRGIVLAAYYNEFIARGLSPEAAARRAEDFMLVIALVNDLANGQVAGYEGVWLPPPQLVYSTLRMLQSEGALEELHRSHDLLPRSVRGQGAGIQQDARWLAKEGEAAIAMMPPSSAQLAAGEQAMGRLRAERAEEQAVANFGSLGSFARPYAYMMEFAGDEPPPPAGELALFLPGESAEDYLTRSAPQLAVHDRELELPVIKTLQTVVPLLLQAHVVAADGGTLHVEHRVGESYEDAARRLVSSLPGLAAQTADTTLRALLAVPHTASGDVRLGAFMFEFVDATLHPAEGVRASRAAARALERCHYHMAELLNAPQVVPASLADDDDDEGDLSMPMPLSDALAEHGLSLHTLSPQQLQQLKEDARRLAQHMGAIQEGARAYSDAVREEAREIIRRLVEHEDHQTRVRRSQE